MPTFGSRSTRNLASADSRLQELFNEVVKRWDCSVLCGERDRASQDGFFYSGKSKVRYPNSKHNSSPSQAVDVAPYPIDWNDLGRFYMFAGYVMRVAQELGIPVRYGGDWDGDKRTSDQTFNDLPHWELING
jgi:hypothetical protein